MNPPIKLSLLLTMVLSIYPVSAVSRCDTDLFTRNTCVPPSLQATADKLRQRQSTAADQVAHPATTRPRSSAHKADSQARAIENRAR